MIKKINANFFRLGINKQWNNNWFENNNKLRQKYIFEDFKIKQYVYEFYRLNSGIYKIHITRPNTSEIRILIHTGRIRTTLGYKNDRLHKFEKKIVKNLSFLKNKKKVTIDVKNLFSFRYDKKITRYITTAKLLSNEMGLNILKGVLYRRVMMMAIRKMRQSGCTGGRVIVSGKLNGVPIARTEKDGFGPMPKSRINANIDYAITEVVSKFGIISVKIYMYYAKNNEITS